MGRGKFSAAEGVKVSQPDGPVWVHIIVGRIQGAAAARVGAVTVLHSAVFEVGLQLRHVVVRLHRLLVRLTLVDRPLVVIELVVGRHLGSCDWHGADGSRWHMQRVDPADGGVHHGTVHGPITLTPVPGRPAWNVLSPVRPTGFDGLMERSGSDGIIAAVRTSAIDNLRL